MIFYQPKIVEGFHELDLEEVKHCAKVLRKKIGDRISIVDGLGGIYEVELTEVNLKQCKFKILSSSTEEKSNSLVHIAVAPTKSMDRMEWFVEKAVEIGIDEISFLECQNSERVFMKLDRLYKKMISAMKQSQRATLPKLNDKVKIVDFLEANRSLEGQQNFIAYVDETNNDYLKNSLSKNSDTCILIGPEGDFTNAEVEKAISFGFKPISLGKHRLRTETAALTACTIASLNNY